MLCRGSRFSRRRFCPQPIRWDSLRRAKRGRRALDREIRANWQKREKGSGKGGQESIVS